MSSASNTVPFTVAALETTSPAFSFVTPNGSVSIRVATINSETQFTLIPYCPSSTARFLANPTNCVLR
ncbi:hypothetical protein SLA2020_076180 [Shorea laevis]